MLVTNAAAGVNTKFPPGAPMVIEDHINLLGNPLVGPNEDALGERFIDMSEAYDRGLRDIAFAACPVSGAARPRGRAPSPPPDRPSRRPLRSACSARWAPTPSGCRRCPR